MTYLEQNKSTSSLSKKPKHEPTSLSDLFEILRQFKTECISKGWQTSENEEWVKTDSRYHALFCTRPSINIYSLRKIAERSKCLIIEGGAYRVVDAAYTAWLLPEPTEHIRSQLARLIAENPSLAEKTALYCFHQTDKGTLECLTRNATNSEVFKEFENFLKDKMDIKLKPLSTRQKTPKQKDALENILAGRAAWD